MPAIMALTLTDGAATPVSHTFNPISTSPPKWRDTQADLPLVGQPYVVLSVKQSTGNGLNKVKVTIGLPTMEVSGGVGSSGYVPGPKVAYEHKVNIEFILPNSGKELERKHIRTFAYRMLLTTMLQEAIDNLSPPF